MPYARGLSVHLGPLRPADSRRESTYTLAGQRLTADWPVGHLAGYLDNSPSDAPPDESGEPVLRAPPGRLIHSGPGLVADAWREVTCYRARLGYRLDIAEVGSFHVAVSGSPITLLETAPGASSGAIEEALLGPVIILSLALRVTWCLHAAAVTCGAGGAAFVGESGSGKSTLAAFLAREGGFLADDILPVTVEAAGLTAWPRFPQLKLPREQQTADLIPERAPLRAIYVLESPDGADAISIQPLGQSQAALALVRHTVAARLFDDALMARHLAFCAEAAGRIAVRRLNYPRRWDALPTVRDRIAADLAAVERR